MFLFWRFSKFFEFFEKTFSRLSVKILNKQKIFVFVFVRSIRHVLIESSISTFLKIVIFLIDFLNSRRFRIFRRVFLLICFLKWRRFLIFRFFLTRFQTIFANFFLCRFREFVEYRFSKIDTKKISRFFQFFN